MKKITVILALVLVFAIALTGCSANSSFTKTESSTVTSADGASTTTTNTTTTNTENGKVSTETDVNTRYEKVPLNIYNITDFVIYHLYCKCSSDSDWGEDLIISMFGSDDPFAVDETINTAFTYELSDPLFDLRIVDKDGGYVDFFEMNFSIVAGDEEINLVFDGTEADGYTCYFYR